MGDAVDASHVSHAVMWHQGRQIDLGGLPGAVTTEATALNEHGQVVGWATADGSAPRQDFIVRRGVMSPIDCQDWAASGIGREGTVIGQQWPTSNLAPVCRVRPPGGTLRLLPTLGGLICSVSDINDRGDIVGSSTLAGPWPPQAHAVLYRQSQVIDLGGLGGLSAAATGLNRQGLIVGAALTSAGVAHGALFRPGRPAVDLNDRLDPVTGAGWKIVAAAKVNKLGQIAATGLRDGVEHALRLDPLR